ncbi:MAG: hypothetical protein HY888_11210 [Deltaproteobacteria bacterium]|nr:hypothetical protein [Deltaproteobacteria bacterium]
MSTPKSYYKWWRRHFRSKYSQVDIIHRLTDKLWLHYNDINIVRERLDRAMELY